MKKSLILFLFSVTILYFSNKTAFSNSVNVINELTTYELKEIEVGQRTIVVFEKSINITSDEEDFNSSFKIIGMKAYLIYNLNDDFSDKKVGGLLSENIIDNPDIHLWNTIIGAGSAEGSSNQTLVVIEIKGNNESNVEKIIRTTYKANNKIIEVKENRFSIYSKDDKYFHAVLLNDTGCDEVEIIAEVLNLNKKKDVEARLSKKISYECGE